MRLISAQPKHTTAFWVVSRPGRGKWHATIIVKAAYRLVPGGAAIADEDKPPIASGDDPSEPGTAPRYASDFVPHKPKADFLVAGVAHAPVGGPVQACRVSIGIGGYTKSLAVFGDRRWVWGPLGARPGEPEPFVTMPLGWERAYGGAGSRGNPAGRGADVSAGQSMPNIEQLGQLITQSTHRPDPAGFGPLSMNWEPRIGKAGTYNARWLAERWPWFPADFEWSFFNAAPPDQQFRHLRGDESLAFENMHPEHAIFRSRLPGMGARAFIERVQTNGPAFEEVNLKLDTVWAEVATERLVLVWRGTTRVHSPRLREIEAICTTLEPLDAPAGINFHQAAFAALREANPVADEAAARRAEIEKIRQAAEARVADVHALVANLRQISDGVRQATGFDTWRKRTAKNDEDPMAALEKEIARLTAQDSAKGRKLEERLQEIDRSVGEILAKVDRRPPWTRERVAAALATGESMAKAKLDGLNLAALDFTGVDLGEATLMGATLSDACLERANLTGADLRKTVLTNTIFARAELSRANFAEATVAGSSFAEARVEGTIFAKLDLKGADFSGATGAAADFTEAVLDGARFGDAALPRAQFSGASLINADFSGADLQAANFSAANAAGIIMERADLTNLRASRGADFSDGRFAHSRAPRSVWQQAILDRASFDRAILSAAQFPEASLRETHFDRAHLDGTNFDDAALADARITNSNLLRASFVRADLTRAIVEGCNLYSAGLLDATLEGTSFEGSMVVQTLLAR